MADTALTLQLDDDAISKLREKAQAAGITVEELAEALLNARLFDVNDFEWVNGDPREPMPAHDMNEPTHAWEDVKAEMLARLERNRRRRA